jgi:hypothetical protein
MRAASELPRIMPPARLPRAMSQAMLLFAAAIFAGAASVLVVGQDANWDLQNYHFYNAWAYVHGRLGWDLAPAQLQTFHNPLVELPFYAMVAAGWPPRWISFALALPAGVGAFFLGKIVLLLFADLPGAKRWFCAALAFAVGITASGPVSMLGSTINEWQGAALVVIALWLVLKRADEGEIGWHSLAAAGLLCGAASGLKLTAATYAFGLCLALLLRPPIMRRGIREALVFAVAGAAGLLLTLGSWMWTLYTHFANPLFPYFNDIFRSPWWDPQPLITRGYGPHTLIEWLTFPLRLLQTGSGFVGELPFRDWRLPLLYLVLIATLVVWIVRHLRQRVPHTPRPAWRLLFVYWIVSFVTWTAIHSIYRYLLPLELFFGALTIHLLRLGLPKRWLAPAALGYAALAIGTVEYPDWWHVEYGPRYFELDVPAIAPHAVVLLVSSSPMAYVLPFFPPEARFLGANNNLNDPKRTNRLEQEVARIVREHDGPLYSLAFPAGSGTQVLAAHALRVGLKAGSTEPDCTSIKTNMSTSPLELCRLQRAAASVSLR